MSEQKTPVVVCGVDGSGHAATAIGVAAGLARSRGARLALVAVNPLSPGAGRPDVPAWTDAELDAVLQAAAREARRLGAEVQCVATQGHDPAEALIAAAADLGADHIVVGTGDRKGVVNWLMGSTAKAVAARAPVSVTIAR